MGGETRSESAADVAPKRRRRRWPWIAALLLVVSVVGFRAALPTIVERGAAYGSRYWLGLPARIDNADFELLSGVVVLEGVSIGADPDEFAPTDAALSPPSIDAAAALVHLDRIAVRLSWQDLREGRVRVTDLALEAPSVRVVREADGVIDPLRHARPLAPPVEDEPEDDLDEAEPWPVLVDRFTLRSPNVLVVDRPSGESMIEFSLEEFALDGISVSGPQLALGGVGIQGPVLRVRRDLILSGPEAAGQATPAAPAPAVQAPPLVAAREPAPAAPASGSPPQPAALPEPVASGEDVPQEAVTPQETVTPPAAAPAQPSGYRIDRIDIARATFTWVTDRGPLDVALALKASDISADEGKRFPLDLQLEIEDGRIALAGDVGILPPSYTGKVSWSGLPFPPLLLASMPDLAVWLRSASSTGDLQLDADIAGVRGAPALAMSGRATIDALDIGDPDGEEIAFGWKQLEVAMKRLVVPLPEADQPARTTVAEFEHVRLTEPKIRYTHPSPALNGLLGIAPAPVTAGDAPAAGSAAGLPEPESSTATPEHEEKAPPAAPVVVGDVAGTPDPAAPVEVRIASFELIAGDAEVVDTTVTPSVTSFVRKLDVSARNVHFPDPSADDIRLSAVLPQSSSLSVEGSLAPGNNGRFIVTLNTLDLPTFSPYAAAAGASLEAGQATLKTKVELHGAAMSLDNDLVLRRLGVSLRDPSSFDRQFGMPIDLALALLRDPAGDIRLAIPVAVDEKGSASVSTGAIVASALRAALVGALTAPLKMLGAVFDSGDAANGGFTIEPIAASPGTATLASDAAARVDALAQLLEQRPAMSLVLRGRVGREDRPLLAEQLLIERLEAGDGLPDLEGAGFLARRRIGQALLARSPRAPEQKRKDAQPLSIEDQVLLERYVASVEVPPERVESLARSRAQALRELLTGRRIAADRIEVGPQEPEGLPGVGIGLTAS